MGDRTFWQVFATAAGLDPEEARTNQARGEPILRAVVESARAAHPDLALPVEAFLEHLGRCMPSAAAEPELLASVPAGDLLLACACAAGVPGASEVFVKAFARDIETALGQLGIAPDSVEDLRQTVFEKLLVPAAPGERSRVVDYHGRGRLTRWVRTVATRTAVDELRAARRAVPLEGALLDRVMDSAPDPELAALRARHAADLKHALADALAALSVRERNVLRHHYVSGLSAERIAQIYRVHRVTAFRWLTRARDELLERARESLAGRVGKDAPTLESLVGLLASQVSWTFSPRRKKS